MYMDSTAQSSLIREVIKNRRPETVRQLVRMLTENGEFEEASCVETIRAMVKGGSLRVGPPSRAICSVLDYLFTPTVSGEFILASVLASLSAVVILFLPNEFPISIFRFIFGAILLCLPGYSTIQLLFPSAQLGFPERLALSIAMTLAIVPIIGFVLNFTPWGIRFQPVITSLAIYAILTSIAAASRSFLTEVEPAQ